MVVELDDVIDRICDMEEPMPPRQLKAIIITIKGTPAAECLTEPSKWGVLETDDTLYACACQNCGYPIDPSEKAEFNFCPNCGRQMLNAGEDE